MLEVAPGTGTPCRDGLGAKLAAQLCLGEREPASSSASPLEDASLQGVASLIAAGHARRIVVMLGAGVSVSAGIPDFRSPGSGLYSQLERFQLPFPEAIFTLGYFAHNPQPFYTLAKELFPGAYCPTPTHFFLRLLADKGLLLTAFTQNVDGLEQLAGVPADRVVHAHGSFDGAHCIACGSAASVYAVQAAAYNDAVATCERCGGFVKPDITFFGEPLPPRFHRRRLADLPQADLLIVLGTSLCVQPFASMIDAVPAGTPRLLINRERVGECKQAQPPRQQQLGRADSSSSFASSSSCGSSSDGGGGGGGGGGGEAQDSSACDSDAARLTASCSDASDCELPGAGSRLGSASLEQQQQQQQQDASGGGFDFAAGGRDVCHLADCDAGVRQLAALLGWGAELEALIEQGRADWEASRAGWDDGE